MSATFPLSKMKFGCGLPKIVSATLQFIFSAPFDKIRLPGSRIHLEFWNLATVNYYFPRRRFCSLYNSMQTECKFSADGSCCKNKEEEQEQRSANLLRFPQLKQVFSFFLPRLICKRTFWWLVYTAMCTVHSKVQYNVGQGPVRTSHTLVEQCME